MALLLTSIPIRLRMDGVVVVVDQLILAQTGDIKVA